MNPHQPPLIRSAIEKLREDSQVVAAFDNDQAGDRLTDQLMDIVSETGRSDIEFRGDRPVKRGADWNQVLTESLSNKVTTPSLQR